MATTKLNIFLLTALMLAAASTLHVSTAQTTHVVGNGLGWTVPSGGSVSYVTWAASRTFTVGDFLIFNFTTQIHDVAEVSSGAFDACNGTNPISMTTNGPANITLRTAGAHFYICTFTRHCDLGQKLAINVSAARSTSPSPAPISVPAPSPSPAAAATPTPSPSPSSRAPETYVVGDALGWVVPPAGSPLAYQTWARGKTFSVGDILVFNFTSGAHDVAELTSRAAYDSCNTSAISNPITISPARITLTRSGQHFFICAFPQHCSLGQKLAINVTGTTATPPASTPANPPSSTGPSPSSNPAPGPSSTSPSGSTVPQPGADAPSAQTPPGISAPPPPNAAPSFASTAALPVTLLSIALAFLY